MAAKKTEASAALTVSAITKKAETDLMIVVKALDKVLELTRAINAESGNFAGNMAAATSAIRTNIAAITKSQDEFASKNEKRNKDAVASMRKRMEDETKLVSDAHAQQIRERSRLQSRGTTSKSPSGGPFQGVEHIFVEESRGKGKDRRTETREYMDFSKAKNEELRQLGMRDVTLTKKFKDARSAVREFSNDAALAMDKTAHRYKKFRDATSDEALKARLRSRQARETARQMTGILNAPVNPKDPSSPTRADDLSFRGEQQKVFEFTRKRDSLLAESEREMERYNTIRERNAEKNRKAAQRRAFDTALSRAEQQRSAGRVSVAGETKQQEQARIIAAETDFQNRLNRIGRSKVLTAEERAKLEEKIAASRVNTAKAATKADNKDLSDQEKLQQKTFDRLRERAQMRMEKAQTAATGIKDPVAQQRARILAEQDYITRLDSINKRVKATGDQRFQIEQEQEAARNRITAAQQRIIGAQEKAESDAVKRGIELNKRRLRNTRPKDAPAHMPSMDHAKIYGEQIAAEQDFIRRMTMLNSRLKGTADQRRRIAAEIEAANVRIAQAQAKLGGMPKGGFWSMLMGDTHQRGLISHGTRGIPILGGMTGTLGFMKNLGTVTGWTLAVGTLYKAINLATYSYQRLEAQQLQTARLTQVFRQQGGTARELADDVLKLAAAEGRGSEEAMQSAISWSRLGLTKKQAAEATRVSLMAANVAEMTSAEATQHLSSVMAGYSLEVSDLASALGILNQASNTYRVTNADLLTGMSRVSSIAQQAGISLAQLTGILAVTVQKTGQSGANMANALKTVIVRMNRADVGDFFEQKFGLTNMTGSADDLQKMWEVYTRVNDEQRRDILLKVGSATQANRLRAILETYADGVFAAVESLRNLNSAEEENIKITNTAAAARQRLITTWDRFVNAPKVEQFMASMYDTMGGIMSGLTPNGVGEARKPKYFDPNKSTTSGALLKVYDILSSNIMMGMNPSAYFSGNALLNKIPQVKSWRDKWTEKKDAMLGFTDKPVTPTDEFSAAMPAIQRAKALAEAHKLRGEWLASLPKTWSEMRPENRDSMLNLFRNKAKGDAQIKALLPQIEAGDLSGVQKLADEDKANSAKKRLEFSALTLDLTEKLNKLLENQNLPLKERQQIEASLADLARSRQMVEYEISDEMVNHEGKARALARAMALVKGATDDVANSFKGLGLSSEVEEIVSLTMQVNVLRNKLSREKNLDAQEKINDQIREAENRLNYLGGGEDQGPDSQLGYGLRGAQRRIGIAVKMTEAETGPGIGLSEGEKLLNRRQYIQSELAKYANQMPKSEVEYARALVLTSQLQATQVELSQRKLRNIQEQKQAQIELNREFQRSLIGASPSELLRKLAIQSLQKRGKLDAGGFFALSPDAQRDAYQMRGGDRMAELKSEAAALSGQTLNLPGLTKMSQSLDSFAKYLAHGLRLNLERWQVPLPVVVMNNNQPAAKAQAQPEASKKSAGADVAKQKEQPEEYIPMLGPTSVASAGAFISAKQAAGLSADYAAQSAAHSAKASKAFEAGYVVEEMADVARAMGKQAGYADEAKRLMEMSRSNRAAAITTANKSAAYAGAAKTLNRAAGVPLIGDLVDVGSSFAGGMSAGQNPWETMGDLLLEHNKNRQRSGAHVGGDILGGMSVFGMVSSLLGVGIEERDDYQANIITRGNQARQKNKERWAAAGAGSRPGGATYIETVNMARQGFDDFAAKVVDGSAAVATFSSALERLAARMDTIVPTATPTTPTATPVAQQ